MRKNRLEKQVNIKGKKSGKGGKKTTTKSHNGMKKVTFFFKNLRKLKSLENWVKISVGNIYN